MDQHSLTELVLSNEPDLVGTINEFYQDREANYGFKDLISAFSIRRTVDFLNDHGKTKAALQVGTWGLEHYPDDYFLSNLMAEFNLGHGDDVAARKAFENSLSILNRIKAEIGEDKFTLRKKYLEEELAKFSVNNNLHELILLKRTPARPLALSPLRVLKAKGRHGVLRLS